MRCMKCIFYYDSGGLGMFGFLDQCGHYPHPKNISDLFDNETNDCIFFKDRPDDWPLIMSENEWKEKYIKSLIQLRKT
jgi:hypothetical protein